MNKEIVRKETKLNRSKLKENEVKDLSLVICNAVSKLQEYKKAKYIFIYMPLGNEVSTLPLIEEALNKNDKVLAFPKVLGKKMDFFIVNSLCELQKGCYNIMEPNLSLQRMDISVQNSVMIMPGVAFDVSGARVGYGGGYYDKYIAEGFKGIKIGICYDFQVFPRIKTDTFDRKCDIIVTEKNVYFANKVQRRNKYVKKIGREC